MRGFMQAAMPKVYETTPATQRFVQLGEREKTARIKPADVTHNIPAKKFESAFSQTAYIFENMPDEFTKLEMMNLTGHSMTRCTEHIKELTLIGALKPSVKRLVTGEVVHVIQMPRADAVNLLLAKITAGKPFGRANATRTEEALKRQLEALDFMPDSFTVTDFMAIGYKSSSSYQVLNKLVTLGKLEFVEKIGQAKLFKKKGV